MFIKEKSLPLIRRKQLQRLPVHRRQHHRLSVHRDRPQAPGVATQEDPGPVGRDRLKAFIPRTRNLPEPTKLIACTVSAALATFPTSVPIQQTAKAKASSSPAAVSIAGALALVRYPRMGVLGLADTYAVRRSRVAVYIRVSGERVDQLDVLAVFLNRQSRRRQ